MGLTTLQKWRVIILDCYRKTKIEKSMRSPCTSPETNALDGSQPILIINYLDEESIRKYEYFDKSDTKQKPDYNGQNVRNKSFIVGITDITENNKAKKVEQLEKALNAMYNRIPCLTTLQKWRVIIQKKS